MTPWPGGRPMSSAASMPTSRCCCAGPSTMPGECRRGLGPCRNGAGHPSIADCQANACSLDGLTSEHGRLAAGEQPAGRGRHERQAKEDHQQIRHGHVSERGDATVHGVASQPADDADVAGERAEDRPEPARVLRRWRRSASDGCSCSLRSRRGSVGRWRSRCGSVRRSSPGCKARSRCRRSVAQLTTVEDVGSSFLVSMLKSRCRRDCLSVVDLSRGERFERRRRTTRSAGPIDERGSPSARTACSVIKVFGA